jgi:hypothetical protein
MNESKNANREKGLSWNRHGWARAIIRILTGAVLAGFVIGVPHIRPARAQTNRFVSTSGNDQGGSNDCSNSGQPCATIQNAVNHSGGGDEIDLGPGTYVENVTVSQSVTIRGDAGTGSTVDGNNVGSTFVINSGVSATLDLLTITNGKALPATQGLGGGISNAGTLTVTRCAITGNHAPQTVVQVNPTTTTTYLGLGGGIYNGGNLTVINSTVRMNSADDIGGGMFNTGTANLVNCTVSENQSNGEGGVLNDVNATLSLTNDLIAGNGGDCTLVEPFSGPQTTLATNDRNFIGDGSCSPALAGNPMLGPFQNNGGPTFTYALLAGSPAIGAADDAVLMSPLDLTTDQRGAGFPRKGCTNVDIGAYAYGDTDPPIVTCTSDIFTTTDVGKATATVSFATTATDACGDPLTPVYKIGAAVITSPHVFPLGSTTVTASATDTHGRTSTCSFTVEVTCTAPTINCPANVSVFTDLGKTTATVTFAATASDPCVGALTPVYSIGGAPISSPFAFPVGTTTVTSSVRGSGGLTSSCTFTVTVTCLPPVVNCPGSTAVFSDPGRTTAKVNFAATASDACDGALTPVYKIGATVITSPYNFPPGVTTVTALATGSNGLSGSCSFTVSVTLLNVCIQDDHSGDTFRFNSTTGQYLYTRCADKFTMTGTGSVRNASGLMMLTDSRADRRISAEFDPGSLTGRANVTLILASGVSETIVVNQTNPAATCVCP